MCNLKIVWSQQVLLIQNQVTQRGSEWFKRARHSGARHSGGQNGSSINDRGSLCSDYRSDRIAFIVSYVILLNLSISHGKVLVYLWFLSVVYWAIQLSTLHTTVTESRYVATQICSHSSILFKQRL